LGDSDFFCVFISFHSEYIIVVRNSPPPSPCGYSVEEKRSKNIFSSHSSDGEEDKDRDLPYSHRDKYDFDRSHLPSIGNITLTESKDSVRLTNDVAVRIPNLRVDTGGAVLATVYFGEAHADQGLYIDNLTVSPTSFLEFNLGSVPYTGGFVFTRVDYSSILYRIGFFDKTLGRRAAKSQYWGEGWYRISVDKPREWNPPMVPEPSAYGAALSGVGLGVVCLKRRRMMKGRAVERLYSQSERE